MSTIRCFWLEETGRATVTLRRYAWAPEPHTQHEASTALDGDFAMTWDEHGHAMLAAENTIADDDTRWPTVCTNGDGCSYVFESGAGRYVSITAIYRRSDTGDLLKLDAKTPAGAMWRERWYEAWADRTDGEMAWRRGPDGMCIAVRTPDGDWSIDRKSAQGSFWTRSGAPPLVTAMPSILFPRYHGWLRNGELVDA